MIRRLIPLILPMLAAMALPALAQEPAAGHVEGGVFVPEGSTLADVRERQAANETQVLTAKQKADDNDASLAAYAKAQAAYEAELARVAEEKRAIAEQAAKAAAEHEAAMARWRADVAACEDGDKSRCAPKAVN